MNKVTAIIIIIIAIIAGMLFGYKLGKKSKLPNGSENTFQAGWEAAKKRLAEFSPANISSVEVKTLDGQVTKVEGNKITIKIRPVDPLSDPELDIRTVTVGKDARIFEMKQKDPQTFQKEMEDFQKNAVPASQGGQANALPVPYEKIDANISKIEVGQTVNVTAAGNIKDAKQFEAVEVGIVQALVAPVSDKSMPPSSAPASQPASTEAAPVPAAPNPTRGPAPENPPAPIPPK